MRALLRLWGVTLGTNFLGLAMLAALFSVHGVLDPAMRDAGGLLADTIGSRDWLPSLLSAIAAGAVMTLFTWVFTATDSPAARVLASLVVGVLLALPSLNHAIVGFGEMLFGLLSGTATIDYTDLVKTSAIAIVGNLIGGVGFVFSIRLAQVHGENGGGPEMGR